MLLRPALLIVAFPSGSSQPALRLRGAASRPEPCHLGVTEAVDDVVVDEAGGLHEGVADRRADEAEAAVPEGPGSARPTPGRARRDVRQAPPGRSGAALRRQSPRRKRRRCRAPRGARGRRGRCWTVRRSWCGCGRCRVERGAGRTLAVRSERPSGGRSGRRRAGSPRALAEDGRARRGPPARPRGIRSSKSRRSSWSGTPHSRSWYPRDRADRSRQPHRTRSSVGRGGSTMACYYAATPMARGGRGRSVAGRVVAGFALGLALVTAAEATVATLEIDGVISPVTVRLVSRRSSGRGPRRRRGPRDPPGRPRRARAVDAFDRP